MEQWQEQNNSKIEEFLERKEIKDGIEKSTLYQYRNILLSVSDDIKKPFKQATELDILKHIKKFGSQRTKNSHIVLLREFYRFLYGLDKEDPLPKDCCVRMLKAKTIEINHLEYSEKQISEEEYKKILDYQRKPMQKAVLESLWFFGSRKDGIQSLLVGDVSFDGVFTHLTIRKDKTEPRVTTYKGRCEHLLYWREVVSPFKDNPNAPLFVVHKTNRGKTPEQIKKLEGKQLVGSDGERYESIKKDYIYNLLLRTTEALGLKHVSPHFFRHSWATRELGKGTPRSHVATQLGWTKSTKMFDIYDHNTIGSYEKYLLQGITPNKKPTYPELEQRYKDVVSKQQKEIDEMKQEIQNRNSNLSELVQTMIADSQRAFFDRFPEAKRPHTPQLKKQT